MSPSSSKKQPIGKSASLKAFRKIQKQFPVNSESTSGSVYNTKKQLFNFCNAAKFEEAVQLVNETREHKNAVDESCYAVLIDALATSDAKHHITSLVESVSKSTVIQCAQELFHIMFTCNSAQLPDEAIHIYQSCHQSVNEDEQVYQQLMKSYMIKRDTVKMVEVLKSMQNSRVKVSAAAFEMVLQQLQLTHQPGLTKIVHQLLEKSLLAHLIQKDFQIPLIRAYAGEGDVDSAMSLIRDNPHPHKLKAIIVHGLCNNGHVAKAVNLFESTERLQHNNPWTFSCILQAYNFAGRTKDTIHFFHRYNKLRKDSLCYHHLIEAYCDQRDYQSALKSFHNSMTAMFKPLEQTVIMMLTLFASAGQLQLLKTLCQTLKSYGLDKQSTAIAERLQSINVESMKSPVTTWRINLASDIQVCQLSSDAFKEQFEAFTNRNQVPIRSLVTAMRLLIKAGELDQAMHLYNHYSQFIDYSTTSVNWQVAYELVRLHVAKKEVDKAVALVERLTARSGHLSFLPTDVMAIDDIFELTLRTVQLHPHLRLTAVIHQQLLRVYKAIAVSSTGNKIAAITVPSNLISLLIRAYGKEGNISAVNETFNSCQHVSHKVSLECIVATVEALRSNQQVKAAITIYSTYERELSQLDPQLLDDLLSDTGNAIESYVSLITDYCSKGNCGKAVQVLSLMDKHGVNPTERVYLVLLDELQRQFHPKGLTNIVKEHMKKQQEQQRAEGAGDHSERFDQNPRLSTLLMLASANEGEVMNALRLFYAAESLRKHKVQIIKKLL